MTTEDVLRPLRAVSSSSAAFDDAGISAELRHLDLLPYLLTAHRGGTRRKPGAYAGEILVSAI
jgi:hypothetical protein